jgi:transcriptional regulator with XRE-family HTH domain
VLKQLSDAGGWSQRNLATNAKGTGAYIAQLETGVQRNLTSNTLKKLAKALKGTVGELVE